MRAASLAAQWTPRMAAEVHPSARCEEKAALVAVHGAALLGPAVMGAEVPEVEALAMQAQATAEALAAQAVLEAEVVQAGQSCLVRAVAVSLVAVAEAVEVLYLVDRVGYYLARAAAV